MRDLSVFLRAPPMGLVPWELAQTRSQRISSTTPPRTLLPPPLPFTKGGWVRARCRPSEGVHDFFLRRQFFYTRF
jgi:hypothetical protein